MRRSTAAVGIGHNVLKLFLVSFCLFEESVALILISAFAAENLNLRVLVGRSSYGKDIRGFESEV